MYKSGANTVYVNTWRVYPGTYPYNNSKSLMSVTASVWLYGKDINGNDFALNSSKKDSGELQLNVSRVYNTGKTDGISIGESNVINGAIGHMYEYNGEIISYATYGNSGAFATASMTAPSIDLPSYAEGLITSVDQVQQIVYGYVTINGTNVQVGLYG